MSNKSNSETTPDNALIADTPELPKNFWHPTVVERRPWAFRELWAPRNLEEVIALAKVFNLSEAVESQRQINQCLSLMREHYLLTLPEECKEAARNAGLIRSK